MARIVIGAAMLVSVTSGCSGSRPVPLPVSTPNPERSPAVAGPDVVPAVARPNARGPLSPIDRALTRLFMGAIFWPDWVGPSGKIIVIDDDVPAEYDAIVVARQFDSLANPNPCRPDRWVSLYAWRPRGDSLGIDVLQGEVGDPILDNSLGTRRGCIHGLPKSDRMIGLYSLAGSMDFARRVSLSGNISISGSRQAQPIADCGRFRGLGMGNPATSRCEADTFSVFARAIVRRSADSAKPVEVQVTGSGIPGFRILYQCGRGERHSECPPNRTTPLPTLPRPVDVGPAMIDHLATIKWGTVVVARTDVIRMRSGTPDSAIVALFDRHGIFPRQRMIAGSLVVTIPDPGPQEYAFERYLRQLRALPEVRSVYPIDINTKVAVGMTTLPVDVADSSGQPIGSATVCLGLRLPIPSVDRRACQNLDGRRSVTFEAPTYDHSVFVSCRPRGKEARDVTDSLLVAVGPMDSARAGFVLPVGRCDPRPFVQQSGPVRGLLSLGRDGATVIDSVEKTVSWVENVAAVRVALRDRSDEPGCYAITGMGTKFGPAGYGPGKALEYRLELSGGFSAWRVPRAECDRAADLPR